MKISMNLYYGKPFCQKNLSFTFDWQLWKRWSQYVKTDLSGFRCGDSLSVTIAQFFSQAFTTSFRPDCDVRFIANGH